MSNDSERQHDAFDNAAKMACRQGNLRILKEAAYLLWTNGERKRLRCDWCDRLPPPAGAADGTLKAVSAALEVCG
jgi:hypothetical protein